MKWVLARLRDEKKVEIILCVEDTEVPVAIFNYWARGLDFGRALAQEYEMNFENETGVEDESESSQT